MKNQPQISVIIPIYNTEKYLKKCLNSIVNQTLKEIEIICVDDGSTDSSLSILQEYAKKDKRVKIIEKKISTGAGDSRNQGIKIANGEYLWFVDSDDWVDLCACEKVYKQAHQCNADIVIFGAKRYDEKNRQCTPRKFNSDIFPSKIFNARDIAKNIFQISIPVAWDKMFKKSFVVNEKIEFQNIQCCNDIGFVQTCIGIATKITYVDDYLYTHRINTGTNISATRGFFYDCCFKASNFIKNNLKQKNMFNITANSFYQYCAGCFSYEYTLAPIIYKSCILKEAKKFLPKDIYFNKFYNCGEYGIPTKTGMWLTEGHCVYSLLNLKFKFKKNKFNLWLFMHLFFLFHKKEKFKDYEYYRTLSPSKYEAELKQWFKKATGHDLNLQNPKTFNEKIQWLKLYDSTPLKTKLADKYLVRDWVRKKIGEQYLIPLLGVYNSFNEINFDKLPNQFVIKCTHGSGYNIIVKDKNILNYSVAKTMIDTWMKTNYAVSPSLQLHYKNIKPRIIVEKYMEDESGELKDYKYTCFNGEPEFIWIDSGRYVDHKRNLYDLNWRQLNCKVNSKYQTFPSPDKPHCLNKMTELAKILSNGFRYVRVDFYVINKKIYFGEMTFTSSSGTEDIVPQEFDYYLADKIKLPQ